MNMLQPKLAAGGQTTLRQQFHTLVPLHKKN